MNSGTLLHRQVNPSWIQGGQITSQVFKPTVKDLGRLSVYDGDRITAESAWRHYTETLGYASFGVLAVNVGECTGLGLAAEVDPRPFPEHAVILFDPGLSNAQVNAKAKLLKVAAVIRGWQYLARLTG